MPLGVVNIPAAMLVLPAFAGRLIWRLARGEAQQTASGGADVAPIACLVAQE
jgi:hypothetical protein